MQVREHQQRLTGTDRFAGGFVEQGLDPEAVFAGRQIRIAGRGGTRVRPLLVVAVEPIAVFERGLG
jgi:hypothetical protein